MKRSTSIFSLEDHGDDAKATDAGGKKSQKDIGGGDQPESENVDCFVTVVFLVFFIKVGLVDSVHPDTSWIIP